MTVWKADMMSVQETNSKNVTTRFCTQTGIRCFGGISLFSNGLPAIVSGPGFSHKIIAYDMPCTIMTTKSVRFVDDSTKRRWCCCRYGWYPVFVAACITAAFLLDLYSSMSCEFLKVHVDTDTGESRGSAYIGIYFHQTGAFEDGQFGEYLAEGCQRYSDEFEATVVEGDRMWQATRYIGMVSAISGGIAAVTCWLLVFAPIPISCIWSGIILPLLFIAFVAGGLKFLFLDVKLCSAAIWYKSRTDCEFATTGFIAVAASVMFFLCVVMVCVHKPKLMVPPNDSRQSKSNEEASTANLINDLELQQTETYDTEPIISEELQAIEEEPSQSSMTVEEEPEVQEPRNSVTIEEDPEDQPRRSLFIKEDPEEQRQSTTLVDPEGHLVPPSPPQETTSSPIQSLTITRSRTPIDPLPMSRIPLDP